MTDLNLVETEFLNFPLPSFPSSLTSRSGTVPNVAVPAGYLRKSQRVPARIAGGLSIINFSRNEIITCIQPK